MNIEELNADFLRAVTEGDQNAVESFLIAGADLNALTPKGNNALYVAAVRKKRDMFDWLLEIQQKDKKIDLNNKNVNGSTLLSEAVKEGDMIYYIEKLLMAGANPNLPSNDGMTPLIKAVADGKKEEIITLLSSPLTDVNYAIEGTKTTAFLMATTASAGSERLEICQILIDKGADIQAQDINGKNALLNALFRTKQFMKKKEKEDQLNLCKFLINQNIDLDYKAPSGMTAFWIASTTGEREIAELMLEKNVKTDVWHSLGLSGISSALHFWMQQMGKKENDEEFIKKMISLGANINAPDEDGNTPAIIGFATPFARKMTLDLGGDVNAVLHQKDAKKNIIKTPAITLIASAGDKQKEIIDEMITRGAKVSFEDTKDLQSKEPIIAAISSNAVGIVDSLLKSGQVNSNLKIKLNESSEEITLLSFLVTGTLNQGFNQTLDKKKQLESLKKAKEINEKNGVVSEIISEEAFAALEEELEQIKNLEKDINTNAKMIFDLLLQHNADVNLSNEKGYTPIFFSNKVEYSEWLINAGADLFAVANNGDDILISAVKHNAEEMLPFIVNKFTEANHPTVNNIFYQLAFSEAKGEYQRSKIENGIFNLLSDTEKETYIEIEKANRKKPVTTDETEEPVIIPKLNIKNINYQDEDGNSGLLVACANDNAFLISLYKKLGADINLANNNGETPLMHAIATGNHRAVEFLIDNGANVNAKTLEDKSILDFAIEIENKEILEKVKLALGHGITEGMITGMKKLKR